MTSISITYNKIPLVVQYTATRTRDDTNPFDVEIEKVCVRGTTHDLYDIIREVDISQITDRIVSAELEESFAKKHLEDEDYT